MKALLLLPTLALGAMLAMPAQAQSLQCREFTTTVTIGGIRQPAWGTTCLQPDGSWQIVTEDNTYQEEPDQMAYIDPQPVYLVKERPVFYRPAFSSYDAYPQTSLSFGYASGDGWGHRRHWGSGVGVGFGRHW